MYLFYIGENWSLERLMNLSKVTLSLRLKFKPYFSILKSVFFVLDKPDPILFVLVWLSIFYWWTYLNVLGIKIY